MEILIAIISSGVLSTIISSLFAVYQNKKKDEALKKQAELVNTEGVRNGVQQLLYDRIKHLCKDHIKRGYIATNELEDLERMHKIYSKELGGNGFLNDLMKEVKELPIKPATVKDGE